MEDPMTITVLVLLTLFSILGTIGNSLVLYIYATKKEKSTAGIFIMSLAGTDLCTCLVIVPYTEAAISLEYKLRYDIVCKIYMFLITCNIPFSAFVMVAIAFDRYFCICHPFLHAINLQRAKCIVLCLLVLASILGLLTSLSHGVYYRIKNEPTQQPTLINGLNTSDLNSEYITNNCTTDFIPEQSDQDNLTSTNNTAIRNTNITCNLIEEKTVNVSGKTTYSLLYIEVCSASNLIFDKAFSDTYQKVYASCYLVSFITVLILYGLIYKSIHKHRAKKNKRKRSSLYPAGMEMSMAAESQITAVTHINPHGNGNGNGNGTDPQETALMQQRPRKIHKPMSIKEKTLLANIRTAAMLFVVTVVFLVAFLPAWLMAIKLIRFNMVIFYMYFVYNTANPFIYAFMNKSFRDDLRKVMKCQSVPMVR